MPIRIEPCRRGGFTIRTDQSYDELLDRVEQRDWPLLTKTTHLAIVTIDGIKVSIRDQELNVKTDDREDAEYVKTSLFDQDGSNDTDSMDSSDSATI
ncbi:MAG: hypothetical protein MUP66_02455 [Candidatus Nanohaloarchaeota archaeon QJJ-5]|nr:hypothetical protein [Candidatus Nanohaloarchaeota archaeon QJJ-5]